MGKRLREWVRPGDILIFILGLGFVIILSAASVRTVESGASTYALIRSGDQAWRFPLDVDRKVDIPGIAGITKLVIEDGYIWAEDSPGPRHIIMKMGKINTPGQWLLSVPNAVFVTIEGTVDPATREVDDVAM
ncbi:NusG domain II-containing protein [Parasphaerochaeta coccoides]|uniref:Uncharacterized protein n=1 Tax=Parasphaerochaeta coccoides (strain ATCC BAA-1237 / DSM 17374 / SPN1) TaxID=760011 RepID=F4GKI2_PARC1|nr:NusG domain II-containing protein [Parasphaerochaeta coccoides]AEC02865.1 hypothetical protein Spico_1667 [Parasphaerochaeta coccoides DSM 17374]